MNIRFLSLSIVFFAVALSGSISLYGSSILNSSSISSRVLDMDSSTLARAKDALREAFGTLYPESAHANGKRVAIEIRASETQVEIIEGMKTTVWSYNGSIPGPEIRLQLGDTLVATFVNDLPQPTTIHWHGVRLPNDMDGVPVLTQDPVQPGERFVYEFTPKDAGTFWFHPHVRSSEQLERGLYGTLVVEDEDALLFDRDEVLVLDDWLLDEDAQVYDQFVTQHDLMHDGRWGNVLTMNGKLDERLSVAPGERLRLRLVNVSNARIYTPLILGLDAEVIAVDGLPTEKPFPLGVFEMAPGNRIDLDVHIPREGYQDSYVLQDIFTAQAHRLLSMEVTASAVSSEKTGRVSQLRELDWSAARDLSPDMVFVLNAQSTSQGIQWMINNEVSPEITPHHITAGDFTIFRYQNDSYRLHPMHLHGQFFKVLSRNGVAVDEPFFRDTVLVHGQEIVDIALVPLDRGDWAQHCHISEHADSGMMSQVTVD